MKDFVVTTTDGRKHKIFNAQRASDTLFLIIRVKGRVYKFPWNNVTSVLEIGED